MFYFFSDFGWQGPYIGEVKAALQRALPAMNIVDLMHDAPCFNPRASAYLLAALSRQFRTGDHCLAVVDPGVGDNQRRPMIMLADEITYVGPDNGLFSIIAARARHVRCAEILWRPDSLATTFHGRDLFAPVIAREIVGEKYEKRDFVVEEMVSYGSVPALAEIIYIDHYGNCVTGLDAAGYATSMRIGVKGATIRHAQTFSAVAPGTPFWYVNSMGLIEIACNQQSAAAQLDLEIGSALVLKRD